MCFAGSTKEHLLGAQQLLLVGLQHLARLLLVTGHELRHALVALLLEQLQLVYVGLHHRLHAVLVRALQLLPQRLQLLPHAPGSSLPHVPGQDPDTHMGTEAIVGVGDGPMASPKARKHCSTWSIATTWEPSTGTLEISLFRGGQPRTRWALGSGLVVS